MARYESRRSCRWQWPQGNCPTACWTIASGSGTMSGMAAEGIESHLLEQLREDPFQYTPPRPTTLFAEESMKNPSLSLRRPAVLLAVGLLLSLAAAPASAAPQKTVPKKKAAQPTVEEARKLLDEAQKRLLDLSIKGQRAGWVQENFLTGDTPVIAAE